MAALRTSFARLPTTSARTFARSATPSFRVSAERTASLRSAAPRRGFASGPAPGATPPPSPQGNNSTLKVLVPSLVAVGGLAYWFLSQDKDSKQLTLGNKGSDKKPVHSLAPGLKYGAKKDYQQVYNAIAEILEADDYDDGSYGPVLLRLAWHSSGTYDKNTNTGGSNAATMRFAPESDHGANAGLIVARKLMEGIKEQFPWISYGDLWTLGGVCAVQELQGPKIPWRPGRIDGLAENCTPDGRLPDGDKGADHVRAIFGRMGFSDQEMVALIGAHAVGRCHSDRSGFDGPWTFSPTTVTNDFYKLLFDEKWQMKKWDGPKQYEDKNTRSLMMLIADMALVQDKSFRKWSKLYADNQDAWFKDFSAAFAKLMELGVPQDQFKVFTDNGSQPMYFKTIDEQKEEAKAKSA